MDAYNHHFVQNESIVNPEGGVQLRYKLDHPPLPGTLTGKVHEDEELICVFQTDENGNVHCDHAAIADGLRQVMGGRVERQSVVLFYNRRKKRGRTTLLANYEYHLNPQGSGATGEPAEPRGLGEVVEDGGTAVP